MTSNFAGIVYIKKANCSDHLVPGSSQTWVFALSFGMEDSEESDITSRSLSPSPVPSESSTSVGHQRKSSSILLMTAAQSFCRVCVVDCSSAATTLSVESPSTTTKLCGHAIAKKYTRPICKLTWRTAIRLSTRNSCKRTIDRKLRRQRRRKQRLRNPWVLYEPKWHLRSFPS